MSIHNNVQLFGHIMLFSNEKISRYLKIHLKKTADVQTGKWSFIVWLYKLVDSNSLKLDYDFITKYFSHLFPKDCIAYVKYQAAIRKTSTGTYKEQFSWKASDAIIHSLQYHILFTAHNM